MNKGDVVPYFFFFFFGGGGGGGGGRQGGNWWNIYNGSCMCGEFLPMTTSDAEGKRFLEI